MLPFLIFCNTTLFLSTVPTFFVHSSMILIEPSQERDGQNEREQAVAERSLRRRDEIKRESKQGEQQGGNAHEDAGGRTSLRAGAGRGDAVILLPPHRRVLPSRGAAAW